MNNNVLNNKIDFAVIMHVVDANPNGDPIDDNMPRTDDDGYGVITDVCIKRKIRNSMVRNFEKNEKEGYNVFLQADDCKTDEYTNIKSRIEANVGKIKNLTNEQVQKMLSTFVDMRSFGALLPYKGDSSGNGVSKGIKGPITIRSCKSINPITICEHQITKSTNNEDNNGKKGSDTIGTKHVVKDSIYVMHGSINANLAEKTGFSQEDLQLVKNILPCLFENDESAARPAGSMEVLKVIWWDHGCQNGRWSSAKVHKSLTVHEDGSYDVDTLNGVTTEEINGF